MTDIEEPWPTWSQLAFSGLFFFSFFYASFFKTGAKLLIHPTKGSQQTRITAVSVVRMPRVEIVLELVDRRHSKHTSRGESLSILWADCLLYHVQAG